MILKMIYLYKKKWGITKYYTLKGKYIVLNKSDDDGINFANKKKSCLNEINVSRDLVCLFSSSTCIASLADCADWELGWKISQRVLRHEDLSFAVGLLNWAVHLWTRYTPNASRENFTARTHTADWSLRARAIAGTTASSPGKIRSRDDPTHSRRTDHNKTDFFCYTLFQFNGWLSWQVLLRRLYILMIDIFTFSNTATLSQSVYSWDDCF